MAPRDPDSPRTEAIPPDAPEADALEQSRAVGDEEEGDELPTDIPPDVPEADALDQARPAQLEEDEAGAAASET